MNKIAIMPYLAPDYAQAQQVLTDSCAVLMAGSVRAQMAFSHILTHRLWRQAIRWFNPDTGEEYESEEDIPPEIKSTVSVEHMFKCQEDYCRWCEDNIQGFRRSTFFLRHKRIDKWVEVGFSMEEAVLLVAGYRMGAFSDYAQSALVFDVYHHVVGYNPESAANLPTLPAPLEEIPEEKRLETIKQGAIKYAEEARAAMDEGVWVGKITGDARRDILREPEIYAYAPQDGSAMLAVAYVQGGEEKFDVPEEVKFLIHFTQVDTGEIVSELPFAVHNWLVRRLKVRR